MKSWGTNDKEKQEVVKFEIDRDFGGIYNPIVILQLRFVLALKVVFIWWQIEQRVHWEDLRERRKVMRLEKIEVCILRNIDSSISGFLRQ